MKLMNETSYLIQANSRAGWKTATYDLTSLSEAEKRVKSAIKHGWYKKEQLRIVRRKIIDTVIEP